MEIKALCNTCSKEFTISSSRYFQNKPCVQCQKRLRGKTNFFEKAKKKFGNAFDLEQAKLDYVDYTTPVTVRCKKHNHTYKIKPVHFVANSYANAPHKGGCSKCAVEASKEYLSKPIEHYLKHLNDKFPNIKVVTTPKDTSSNLNKITLSCPIHGDFVKTLADLVRLHPDTSSMCPLCSQEKLAWNTRTARTDVKGYVYFVKFTEASLYKCGVTYKGVKERFKGVLSKIEELWVIELPTLEKAFILENALFRKYSKYRTCYPDTTFGGYTEFLSINVEKPDERFIEEILCRKESNSGEPLTSNVEGNPERSLDNCQETCRD
jgi:hypothetical protein